MLLSLLTTSTLRIYDIFNSFLLHEYENMYMKNKKDDSIPATCCSVGSKFQNCRTTLRWQRVHDYQQR